jgi:hypothetical protein
LLSEQTGIDITYQKKSKFRKTRIYKKKKVILHALRKVKIMKGENYCLLEAQRPVGNYNIRK